MATAGAKTTTIATGNPSGLYYPFGGGLSKIWSRESDDINMKAEVTAASVVNVIQVMKGESEAGISQGDVLRDAIAGKGIFPEPIAVRALFALYPNVVHCITRESSGLASIQDLRGKRVSVGAPGSGVAITSLNILGALGITPDDFEPQYLSYTETAEALKTGTIDAGFMVGGLGLAALMELALTEKINLIPVTGQDMDTLSQAYPAYTRYTIPADTYNGITQPLETVSLWNFLVVAENMDDERAYRMTRLAFENMDEMLSVTKAARHATIDNALTFGEGILHPAALRYLREQYAQREGD